ncbi:MAG: hypothetical protein LBL66_07625 [Clostridiales bacterium]|jgi:hypothetical protein|nr:hypothetical protein [Clostridiales bacterium]
MIKVRKWFCLGLVLVMGTAFFACKPLVKPRLNTPAGVTADPAAKTLVWQAVTDASGYSVEIDGTTHGAFDTAYSLAALTAEKTYRLRVKAMGGKTHTDSEWSEAVAYTADAAPAPGQLAAPANLTIDETAKKLTWDETPDAQGYNVQIRTDATSPTVYSAAAAEYSLAGLTPNVWKIRVQAEGDEILRFRSDWSDEIVYALEVVKLRAPYGFGTNTSRLFWSEIDHAQGYEVKIDGETPFRESEPSISLNLLPARPAPDTDTPYKIEVRALSGSIFYTDSEWTATSYTAGAQLPAPEGLGFKTADGQERLTWDWVVNADGYEIYQKSAEPDSEGDKPEKLGDVFVTGPEFDCSYPLGDLTRGGYYLYVKSLGDGTRRIDSEFSAPIIFAVTEQLARPALEADRNAKVLTWEWDEHAQSYLLSALTPSSETRKILILPDEYGGGAFSYSLETGDFDATGKYQIKIQAQGSSDTYYSESDWSETVPYTVQEQLQNPSGLAVEAGVLVWNKVEHASGYRVEIAYIGEELSSGCDWASILYAADVFPADAESPECVLSDLEIFAPGGAPTGYYGIRVVALGDSGKDAVYTDSDPESDGVPNYSTYAHKEKLRAPASLDVADDDSGGIMISWEPVTNAARYEIQIFEKKDGKYTPYVGYNQPLRVDGESHTVSRLSVGDYKIVVRAVGNEIYTDSDEAVREYRSSMILEKPDRPSVTRASDTSVLLRWTVPPIDYSDYSTQLKFEIEVWQYNNSYSDGIVYDTVLVPFDDAPKVGSAFEFDIISLLGDRDNSDYNVRIKFVSESKYYITNGDDNDWSDFSDYFSFRTE